MAAVSPSPFAAGFKTLESLLTTQRGELLRPVYYFLWSSALGIAPSPGHSGT